MLAASRARATLLNCPLLLGSGKLDTPCTRMQLAKASAFSDVEGVFVDAATFVDPREPADDGLPPHADTASARAVVMMSKVVVRTMCCRGGRGAR